MPKLQGLPKTQLIPDRRARTRPVSPCQEDRYKATCPWCLCFGCSVLQGSSASDTKKKQYEPHSLDKATTQDPPYRGLFESQFSLSVFVVKSQFSLSILVVSPCLSLSKGTPKVHLLQMQMQDSRYQKALRGTGGAQDLKNRNEWKVRGHLLPGLGFRVRRQEIIE